ncbi:MAG: calcium/sodium antiporter [Cellvibrionaceae bacterium]
MNPLLLASLAILAGFIGLVWSADRFVAGSAAIARHAGLSRLIVGLTIVSLGTSAPEIVVSANASLEGAGDIAIGNAIGSNIANVGLVLAVTLLIAAIPVQGHLLKQEAPILLLVSVLAGVFLFDAHLSFVEGVILLASIAPVMGLMIYIKRKHPSPEEEGVELPADMSNGTAWLWFAIGLGILLVSADILVWGATSIATEMGVSQLVIGLTVIAIGTSLPELAASIASALKGHHDIALGNIIGSNIFNILTVMSLPGIISPLTMDEAVFSRDYTAMMALTLTLIGAIAFTWMRNRHEHSSKQPQLGRAIGVVLLLGYIAYYIALIPQATAA